MTENETALPLGWDETHLEAYRDGYHDALIWALSHDEEEIQEVLDAECDGDRETDRAAASSERLEARKDRSCIAARPSPEQLGAPLWTFYVPGGTWAQTLSQREEAFS